MLSINNDLCKGCSYCVKFCPKSILTMGKERNKHGHFVAVMTDAAQCISCGMCANICPEGAIEIKKEEQ